MSQRDLELSRPGGTGWWYSLIQATPVPEDEEAVNIGVLLGNGKTSHLAYRSQLPRLSCLAPGEVVEALQFVLSSVRDRVGRGMDFEALQAIIGPQMRIAAPRSLYNQPSDAVVEHLVRRFLETPQKSRVNVDDIIARSDARLEAELQPVQLGGLDVIRWVKPASLYGASIRGAQVPELARAIRSAERDVLLDSVAVERGVTQKALREATTRIGRAFWTYKRYQAPIRAYEHRDIKLVGILHPSEEHASRAARDMREYIKDVWSASAEVIDGDEVNVTEALQTYANWAREPS